MFVRFKRIKTTIQQGIALFKDKNDFLTCPLHALAVSLVMEQEPSARFFAV